MNICRSVRQFCSVAGKGATVQVQRKKLNFKQLQHTSKIPKTPHISAYENTPPAKIKPNTFQLLERLSLVDLDGHEAQQTIERSIHFAEKIVNIDTSDIQPLYMVLYEQPLRLRKDQITEGNCRDDILQNASVTDEDYFISPPGNIPLSQDGAFEK
ncbi:glutamyl-tRNA(Gln) amidotransferase subunit C, mitochondrial [Haematobia irritans]|uniref:glutamyl-tRNA(Gln) amidotransferase subunit C, mitochondrial n=1 Tax=Haematobia irritans TaxID=7368 RepID=UPI003F500A88